MPFNGSGTFTLAQPAFVPSTVISSSAMNSDLSDIATNGLTNAVAKDGQTTITGAFKGFTGSVGAPMYSFSADTDCGMYRIGANNIGLSVNATKIVDIATTGVSVVGALSATTSLTVLTTAAITGQSTLTGGFLSGDGTVMLPAWSFTSDPDSGVYRIGANNIGVAVNAAKVLDIGTTGLNVVGTVSSNGAAFTPQAQAAGMVNGTITATQNSPVSNAITFALKTKAGTDPSATDIVYFVFRNVTAATGDYTVIQVTAAMSIVVSSGSTLGTASSNVPFKLWLVAFNDAGTVRLGVVNCVLGAATPTSIYPLGQFPIGTSTAEGGSGGADSAQVFYTGTAVASKAYEILAYASYETGVTTAGAWTSAPTRLQLFGDGVPLPGTPINPVTATNVTATTTSSSTFQQTSSTIAITPTSAAHLIAIKGNGAFAVVSGAADPAGQLSRGTSPTLIGFPQGGGNTGGSTSVTLALETLDAPGVTTSVSYYIFVKSIGGGGSLQWLGATGGTGGLTYGSTMRADEIVT